jgi:hypothetical protein
MSSLPAHKRLNSEQHKQQEQKVSETTSERGTSRQAQAKRDESGNELTAVTLSL